MCQKQIFHDCLFPYLKKQSPFLYGRCLLNSGMLSHFKLRSNSLDGNRNSHPYSSPHSQLLTTKNSKRMPPPQTPQARMSYVEFVLSKTYDPATTTERQFVHDCSNFTREQGRTWRTPRNGTNMAARRGSAGKKRHANAKVPPADITWVPSQVDRTLLHRH